MWVKSCYRNDTLYMKMGIKLWFKYSKFLEWTFWFICFTKKFDFASFRHAGSYSKSYYYQKNTNAKSRNNTWESVLVFIFVIPKLGTDCTKSNTDFKQKTKGSNHKLNAQKLHLIGTLFRLNQIVTFTKKLGTAKLPNKNRYL